MKALVAALVQLALAACVHATPFSPRALTGQSFPLRPGFSLALALDGSVAGHPAIIHLAVEEPLSRVTDGCFESPPEVLARVHTGSPLRDGGPGAGGRVEEQVLAGDVRLGTRLLGDVRALRDVQPGCVLTLGSEVLIGFVLEVDPGARTVTFHGQTPPPPKYQSEQSVVLELTLDPRTDTASLAIQLDTARRPLTLPMLLATAAERVQLSVSALRALVPGDVGTPGPLATSLAFAPDWVLRHVIVSALPGESPPAGAGKGELAAAVLSGVLGAEAWGHFRALIDLRGQRLTLYRRPPALEGGPGPQSWTQLSTDSTQNGTLLRLISWQTLDEGGQVVLEPSHVQLRSCRIGLTLGPEDPGVSLKLAIPWEGLEKALPDCARELAQVPAWTGELGLAAGPRPCRGTCIYAQALPSGRTVCNCSGRPVVASSAGRKPAPAPVPAPETREPQDPPGPATVR